MQCNKSGCKQQFHVTCAQARGLLCEEAGNYLDNVKYCGYCQHHYSKLVRHNFYNVQNGLGKVAHNWYSHSLTEKRRQCQNDSTVQASESWS